MQPSQASLILFLYLARQRASLHYSCLVSLQHVISNLLYILWSQVPIFPAVALLHRYPKLGDLGFAKVLDPAAHNRTYTFCGTPGFGAYSRGWLGHRQTCTQGKNSLVHTSPAKRKLDSRNKRYPHVYVEPWVWSNKAQMNHATSPKRTLPTQINTVSPESICGRGYNMSVDWWALGVTLYVLLTARNPFTSPRTSDPMDVSFSLVFIHFASCVPLWLCAFVLLFRLQAFVITYP